MASPFSLSGFARGFVETTSMLGRLALAKQNIEARQAAQKERIKLLKRRVEGQEATLRLAEQEFRDQVQQRAQLFQGRQQAASALNLLSQTPEQAGFRLDPQARGELEGIVRQQAVSEGGNAGLQKLLAVGQDRRRRSELAESIRPFLSQLSEAQQGIAGFALQSFQQGGIDDNQLMAALGSISGSSGPRTMLELAFRAAGAGPPRLSKPGRPCRCFRKRARG